MSEQPSEQPKKPKATKALVAQRVEEVLRIVLDGAEVWDLREYAKEKAQEAGSAWELPPDSKPLSDSQLFRYLAKAHQLIAESCRASRKKLLRKHLAQRRNLYAKAVSQGDTRAALAIHDSEAKLIGLFAPVKVAPTNPKGDKPYAALPDADAAAALAALYARLGARTGDATADGPDAAGGSLLGGPVEGLDGRGNDPGRMAGEPSPGDVDPSAFTL